MDGEDQSVSVKTFSLKPNIEEEILVFIGQLFDAKNPLHYIVHHHLYQLPH